MTFQLLTLIIIVILIVFLKECESSEL